METKLCLDRAYRISEDVVARNIQGEFIIIPIVSGIVDMEDEIFSLNQTGRAVWERLDGRKSLREIAGELSRSYNSASKVIEQDVLGLARELLKRNMLVEVKRN